MQQIPSHRRFVEHYLLYLRASSEYHLLNSEIDHLVFQRLGTSSKLCDHPGPPSYYCLRVPPVPTRPQYLFVSVWSCLRDGVWVCALLVAISSSHPRTSRNPHALHKRLMGAAATGRTQARARGYTELAEDYNGYAGDRLSSKGQMKSELCVGCSAWPEHDGGELVPCSGDAYGEFSIFFPRLRTTSSMDDGFCSWGRACG